MNIDRISEVVRKYYDIEFDNIKLYREGGNDTYNVFFTGYKNYFLKIIRPPFIQTALSSIDIQLYLHKNDVSVIPIIYSKNDKGYIEIEKYYFVIYEYIEGDEPLVQETEKVGELVGKAHSVMANYPNKLVVKGKEFFIDRYIEIMKRLEYPKVKEFEKLGEKLWDRVKNLPKGFCHGDLYRGNIHRAEKGKLYMIDFDTSCRAFPIYDIALFCNDTDYFNHNIKDYDRTKIRVEEFVKGYKKHCEINDYEISAIYDLIGIYHFQLQATIIERFGDNCIDIEFLDNQLDWLKKWCKQCEID